MELAKNMQNLADDIRASFDARMNFLGENSRNTKRALQNARKFMGSCRQNHKAMARQLRTDLDTFTENLADTVEGLRRAARRRQAGFHKECQAGHNAFQKLQEEMGKRRRNPRGNGEAPTEPPQRRSRRKTSKA